jgi:Fic-DOC domain mobile mystery protein B
MNKLDYPEGATALDPDELAGLKLLHVTTRSDLDHLEQENIQDGLRWLERRRNKIDVLHEAFVRTLHKRLFGDVWAWAGTFRTTEKNISIDPLQISVQLRHLLDDVSYWIDNKTYAPLEIAVRLHHRLVYIHPFPNGNGRHARIMADVVLSDLLQSTPIDWGGGQNLQAMTERRKVYIAALAQADSGAYGLLFQFAGLNKPG